MTWIKICGTTNLHDAEISVAAGADALGFIFAPSPRRIEVDDAAEIIARLPVQVEKIGVFVDEDPARVSDIVRQAGLTGVQLHGSESAERMLEFRLAMGECKIVKTLQVSDYSKEHRDQLVAYLSTLSGIDAVLLDSGSARQPGGTGARFSWGNAVELAAAIRDRIPLIVAGGLTAENAGGAIDLFQPWGVDVVSGVECAPGKKDERKLREFVAAVREHAPARARRLNSENSFGISLL